MNANLSPKSQEQYNLTKILALWAAATVPMAVLSWVVYPLVAPD